MPLCEHPTLPGARVEMATPRNGWKPVGEEPRKTPRPKVEEPQPTTEG